MTMIASSPHNSSFTLLLIEAGLTLVAVATAFTFPRFFSRLFARCEGAFASLARRKRLACATVGASALLLRLALLPFFPVPLPFLPDDFSFLLAADTFAHGRLTNLPPLMWAHFESVHVTVLPTYTSMYFPGPGLVLAAGKVLFGNPWIGILLTTALMCAAICWALQAWLPPTWALLGGFLSVLRIGLFSYWINTYTGGAPIAALGGALVLGSLPFWVAGTAMSVYTIPHYLAPFTVAAYILGIQALRHLRAATAGGGAPVGRTFVRLAVTVCIVMAGLRAFSAPLHLAPSQSSIGAWEDTWLGPGHFGAQRAAIVNKLDRIPGNHLVLVRYESSHDPMDEWVYNDANIDGSRIIWARDMDAVSNQELIRFYGDRDVWLVQPDADRGRLSPYPNSPALMAAGMRKP